MASWCGWGGDACVALTLIPRITGVGSVESRSHVLRVAHACSGSRCQEPPPLICRVFGIISRANAVRVHFQLRAAGSRSRYPAQIRSWARGDCAAGARLVAWLPLARAHQSDRGGAGRESRHRRRHRPHHAGRRAGQDRRLGAAAGSQFHRLRGTLPQSRRAGPQPVPGGAQRQLRDRFLGQEPRRLARGAADRRREPVQQGGGGPLDHRERGHRLFQRALLAGPVAHRAEQPQRRQPRAHADQAAVRGRHRLPARRRATGESGRPGARDHPAVRPDAAAEHRHSRRADRQAAGAGADQGRQHLFAQHSAGDAGAAVGAAAAASRHPRRRGGARLRRCQRRGRARRVLSEHLAHRPGRLPEQPAQAAVAAGERVLQSRRQHHPAAARRLPAGGAARADAGPAIRAGEDLLPDDPLELRRRGDRADRHRRRGRARAPAEPCRHQLARGLPAGRDAAARRHRRPRHRAADSADPVHGRGPAGGGAACAPAGGVESVPGARRRLASARRGGGDERSAMSIKRRITVLCIAGLVIAGVVAVYYMPHWQQTQAASKGGRRGGPAATDPVPVLATAARSQDVPVYLDGVGTARALNTVTVRSQVDGKIIAISFVEGQDVPQGFVLAKIDPTTYQAQYDQAVANKAKDEAQLANARVDFDRYTRLAATNAVNKQQLDTQKALVAQLEAQFKLDQAAIDNARAILSYTDVVAPIAGRTGIRLVDQGNLVRAADTTGIVILTQLRPISVFFSLPQQTLPDLNKGMAESQLPVDALAADGKGLLDKGKVVVIDNQVDQTTGTVKIKAEFPNTNLQLWPGQFINVRVLIDTLRNVVVVPTAAIQRGPNGAFVYVLKDDSTVTVRRVSLTQLDDVQAVVATGLQAGERVVTTGFARLTEGAQVTASSAEDAGQVTPGAQPRPAPDGTRGTRERGKRTPTAAGPPVARP